MMGIKEAEARLYDSTFLIGAIRRRSAIKALSLSSAAETAALLVRAVEKGHPNAGYIKDVLKSTSCRTWTDRMWHIWSSSRQEWLGDILTKTKQASQAGGAETTLSLLKLGKSRFPAERDTALALVSFLSDRDRQVTKSARSYFEDLYKAAPQLWVEALLIGGCYAEIGNDRASAREVIPFLSGHEEKVRNAALSYFESIPPETRVFVHLASGAADSLPLEEKTAWMVIPYLEDTDPAISKAASAYAAQVKEHAPPFFLRFMLKAGRAKDVPVRRKTVAEGLSLLTDRDAQIQGNAERFISGLPHEQTVNDLIVDEWVRTESPFLEKTIVARKRLPSDPAKEALLFLVTGNVMAYNELQDEEGQYLIEAIAMATPGMRTKINACVMESRDSQLSSAYHRATMGSKYLDPEIALRALIASGNEDGLVKAAENMTLAKLLELCGHWEKTGRRPTEEKSLRTVENALSAYRKIGDSAIEPGQALPEGLQDLFEEWLAIQRKDKEMQNDLKAADPFIRARGLFIGSRRGSIDQETLRQKSKSPEWPERLIAALASSDIKLKDDHCHWALCSSGFLDECLTGKVACGLDEYERCEETRARLKKNKGFWAVHTLSHLSILQTFRGLFIEGAIVFSDGDSPDDERAVTTRGIKKERQGD